MADVIQSIFVDPPNAIARLGGSSVPQDAYFWAKTPQPRTIGETTIAPTWSLTVQADGTIQPFKPLQLVFRDGAMIRPVCPFLELWARVGAPGSSPTTWRDVPLTLGLLAGSGVSLTALTVEIDAKNFKASRRTGNPALRFGTFPPVRISGDNHAPVPLLAVSPPGSAQPMIPLGQNIPMGSVQILRSMPQPSGADWVNEINVETIRIRFTPGRGHVYGVPRAAQPSPTPGGGTATPGETTRAFLNPSAGWFNAVAIGLDAPADTYDGADISGERSLGVVDDTCEALIEVSLQMPGAAGRVLKAAARVFVGPPDFAPDRRPFLSLADELNDRVEDAGARSAALTTDERDAWVQDLFERIFETISLLNVDLQRNERGLTLRGNQLRPTAILNDQLPRPTVALGGRDALRNPSYTIPAPTPNNVPLPLTQHAHMRHRTLSDVAALRGFVSQNRGRLQQLVRAPFEAQEGESTERTTMQMPPLMRNSNAFPLTLSAWQYDLLMRWVAEVETQPAEAAVTGAATAAVAGVARARIIGATPTAEAAWARRAAVLSRLRGASGGQEP
jgi:hypothetical protein